MESPKTRKNIRANMAVERVKEEIQLLRMKSEKSQEKVIDIDEQMIQALKKKANGKILEILENRWRSDCEKEEKRSQERYRIKEIWQLDYVRKYGNSITKEKFHRKPKKHQSVQPTENRNDFADVARHNSTSTSQQRNTRCIQRQERTPYMRNIHSESQQQTSPKRLNNEHPPQNQDRYNYPNKRHTNNQQGTWDNIHRKKGKSVFFRRRQIERRGEIQTPTIPEKRTEPKVINLSNRQLNEFEIQLLSKGLKYTPTTKGNKQELRKDIKEYTRRLRLAEFFHKEDSDDDPQEK
jgi:hypothetical protein